MARAARRYNKTNLGYYLDKPTEVIGGYDRAITLVLNPNDLRYTGASFLDDDWFKYIAAATTNHSLYLTESPRTVNRCITANSRLDDDLLRRYGFRVMLPDLLADFHEMGEEVGTELLNDWFADNVIELFDTNREAFKRIYAVINEEYQPLYNLDVTYTEQHSGTDVEGIEGTQSTSRTLEGDRTTEYKGSETDAKSGSDTLAYSGSETNRDGDNSKTTTHNSTYAFNSSDPVPESVSEVDHDTETTKSFTNRQDQTTYNSSDTHSFTNRKDETAIDDTEATDTTTASDRSFTHGEKITTRRYGNQGITKSTELLEDEIRAWSNIDFVHYVTDIVAHRISII